MPSDGQIICMVRWSVPLFSLCVGLQEQAQQSSARPSTVALEPAEGQDAVMSDQKIAVQPDAEQVLQLQQVRARLLSWLACKGPNIAKPERQEGSNPGLLLLRRAERAWCAKP